MGRNSDMASGIRRSDFTRAATIPKRKKSTIGVSRFDWMRSRISIRGGGHGAGK